MCSRPSPALRRGAIACSRACATASPPLRSPQSPSVRPKTTAGMPRTSFRRSSSPHIRARLPSVQVPRAPQRPATHRRGAHGEGGGVYRTHAGPRHRPRLERPARRRHALGAAHDARGQQGRNRRGAGRDRRPARRRGLDPRPLVGRAGLRFTLHLHCSGRALARRSAFVWKAIALVVWSAGGREFRTSSRTCRCMRVHAEALSCAIF